MCGLDSAQYPCVRPQPVNRVGKGTYAAPPPRGKQSGRIPPLPAAGRGMSIGHRRVIEDENAHSEEILERQSVPFFAVGSLGRHLYRKYPPRFPPTDSHALRTTSSTTRSTSLIAFQAKLRCGEIIFVCNLL